MRNSSDLLPAEQRADNARLQWGPALGAGLIPGLVLLLVPVANPWSGFTVFGAAIIGRAPSPAMGLSLPAAWAVHLALSLIYGIIISIVVLRLRQEWAILAGGVAGAALFLVNWGVVAALWPWWNTNLFCVFFAHLAFGLISAGAYRGLRCGRERVPTTAPPNTSD